MGTKKSTKAKDVETQKYQWVVGAEMIRADLAGSRDLLVPNRSFKHQSDKQERGLQRRWAGCPVSASHVPLKRHFYKFVARR